jgi:hypothetical protein
MYSPSYHQTLKALYLRDSKRFQSSYDGPCKQWVNDIAVHLTKADEQYGCQRIYDWLEDDREISPDFCVNYFQQLLHYHSCRLLLNVLQPSAEDLDFAIVEEARFFTLFSRIEYSVDRLEMALLDERDLLSFAGSNTQDLDDPLLSLGKVYSVVLTDTLSVVRFRLELVRKIRDGIMARLERFCQVHHNIIHSLLVHAIDYIPTRTRDGRLGWLTEVFMNHFGWNSTGNQIQTSVANIR